MDSLVMGRGSAWQCVVRIHATRVGHGRAGLGAAAHAEEGKLDGSDTWPISSANTNGKLPGGAVTSNVYDSGRTLGTAVFSMPSGGIVMNVTLHHVRITGTLSGQVITDGVLSGVLATDEFVTELKRIAGTISTTLCGTQFDGIAQQIRQAQDILDDGTQDPTKSCNGISVGLGFEAVSIKTGAVLNDPPPPDPCL